MDLKELSKDQLIGMLDDFAKNWLAHDGNGIFVSSGIYFYSLHAGDYNQTKKMILLR